MDNSFSIRRSTARDIDSIMEVYDSARHYMRETGNHKQWIDGYPDKETILADIARYSHFLAEDEEGELLMVFSFILGDDPTYKIIENGSWLNERAYGTIHRIASTGMQGGMLKAAVSFCASMIDNIRIDTHADNGPMLNALHKLNFTLCGVIYTKDGSPRLAFQKDYRPNIILPISFDDR